MPNVTANGIQIEYDTFGDSSSPALLLIMGAGGQMIFWEPEFCESLAKRGHYVIRFDNRDVGLSTKFEKAGIPDIMAAMEGKAVNPAYSLDDMADDAAGLLDALGIEKAHICGASMGGMIAQIIAYRNPERVLSLTSMMSCTGNTELLETEPEVSASFFKPVPPEREAFIEHQVNLWRKIWSPGFPFDEERMRRLQAQGYDRSYYPKGIARQTAAVIAHGDRRPFLRSIKAPTLVIHGDADPLIPVEAGKETAEVISGAKLLIIKGMGHDMPEGAWPEIIDAVANNTK